MIRKRPERISNERGLTLLELTIAVGIMTIVITIAYAGLAQIIRSKQILDDERDLSMVANAVLTRMTRELQRTTEDTTLLPPPGQPNKKYGSVYLLGEQNSIRNGESGDEISFMASDAGQYIPDGLTHTGVVMIRYRAEQDPDAGSDQDAGYLLIRDEIPDIKPVEEAYKRIMTFPVTKQLVGLEFRYYDIEEEEWSNDWDEERGELPALVKFTVKLRSPRGKIHTFSTMVSMGN